MIRLHILHMMMEIIVWSECWKTKPSGGKIRLLKGQKISKKKYVVLDSSKNRTLGQSYVLKIAPAFIFWKNPGRHNLLLRFTDLLFKWTLNLKTPYSFKTRDIYILVQNDRHCVMFQLECRHLLETENRSRTSDHECGEFVRPKPPAVPLFSD